MNKHLIVGMALATLMPLAQAAPITVSYVISFSDSHGSAVTNWDHNLALPYFDGTLGTLVDATFSYGASVTSEFGIENRDRRLPQAITATARAAVTFSAPQVQTLNLSNVGGATLLAKFDGVTDFRGTSGATQSLTATGSSSYLLNSPLDLAALVGTGNFLVPVSARALSTVSGSGNLASSISTTALASVQIDYRYNRTVPEPGAMLLAMTAIAAMGFGQLKRRKPG